MPVSSAVLFKNGVVMVVALAVLWWLFVASRSILLTATVGIIIARLGAFKFVLLLWYGGKLGQDQYQEMLKRSDTMAQPITEKHSARGENGDFIYGMSNMQGWRRNMEDAHTTVLAGSAGTNPASAALGEGTLFAVFDGHSGPSVAQFCGEALPKFLADTPDYRRKKYAAALKQSFIDIDRHLIEHPTYRHDKSGCTANAILLMPDNSLYCANAGDSRSVLCRDGAAYPLSTDHKPHLPEEFHRIQAAKHFVWNRRVDGMLALSRAIGDFQFKRNDQIPWEQQAVTCVPEVKCEVLDPKRDTFIVCACDGIWDVLTNEQVVTFVKAKLAQRVEPQVICELLMTQCLSPQPFGLGCDNMSVILIILKHKNGGGTTSSVSSASGNGGGGKSSSMTSTPGGGSPNLAN